jgi:DNA-binding transcriptional ArsR family regulator
VSAIGVPVSVDAALVAWADPLRRRTVDLLAQRRHRARELAEALGVTPPTMSRHLRISRQSGPGHRYPSLSFDTWIRL